MNQIYICENFLSENLCSWLINFHKTCYKNFGIPTESQGIEYLDLISSCYHLQGENAVNDSDPIKYLLKGINSFTATFSNETFINFSQIVRYPEHTKYEKHIDHSFSSWTSILYLNEDFDGGQTVVGDKIIFPKIGKFLIFRGRDIEHEVTEITSGNRYVIASWHKDFEPSNFGIIQQGIV